MLWAACLLALGAMGVTGNCRTSAKGVQFDNPGVIDFDQPQLFSRVIALSDVHGMDATLLTLLRSNQIIDSQNHWTAGQTLLIVVGDSIDKGPQSIEVLDLWISLQAQASAAGGQLVHLLGNHEAEFLAAPNDDSKATELLAELRQRGIPVSDLTDPSTARGRFLRSMPLAARVGKWVFCHAGFLPQLSWAGLGAKASALLSAGNYGDPFLIGGDSLLEAKGWWGDPTQRSTLESRLDAIGAYGLVFGHQPKALNVVGQDAITDDGRIIKIDNGMAPEAGSHSGHLLLFNHPGDLLDTETPSVTSLAPDGSKQDLAHESSVDPDSGRRDVNLYLD